MPAKMLLMVVGFQDTREFCCVVAKLAVCLFALCLSGAIVGESVMSWGLYAVLGAVSLLALVLALVGGLLFSFFAGDS